MPEAYDAHPGNSLFELAAGSVPDRNVLCEYHGMGSTTGAFMIRHGKYKYVHYVAYPPQLFDLEADPEELRDLAGEPAYAKTCWPNVASGCYENLRSGGSRCARESAPGRIARLKTAAATR